MMPTYLVRCGLAILCTAAAFGCDSVTEADSITLSVAPTSVTVNQGASTSLVATVIGSAGFTGAVSLTVIAPTGVSGAASNIQTSGTVTTATIAIVVGAATAPGAYTVTVRANAPGVAEVTATFTVNVTQPPSYTLTLSPATLTIARGASTPTTTVNIARINFTGGVALSLQQPEDPALPAGITAAFNPNPATDVSSILTITVGNAVPTGTYPLLVRGAAAVLTPQIAPLTLIVTAP